MNSCTCGCTHVHCFSFLDFWVAVNSWFFFEMFWNLSRVHIGRLIMYLHGHITYRLCMSACMHVRQLMILIRPCCYHTYDINTLVLLSFPELSYSRMQLAMPISVHWKGNNAHCKAAMARRRLKYLKVLFNDRII